MRTSAIVAVTGLCLFSVGCSSPIRFTKRSQSPVELEPAPGKARIVFINAGKLTGGLPVYLLHADKRLIAESIPFSHSMIDVDPGKYTFYGVSRKDGAKLEADLSPDKTYFVQIRVGFSYAVELVALTERRQEWVNRDDWVKNKTSPIETDLVAGQAFVDKYKWFDAHMKKADAKLAEMTQEQIDASFKLHPDDGV